MKMFKLRNGDCLKVMAKIPDNFIDLVLTDPPYGTTACKWDSVIPLDLMWKELKRITKPASAIVINAAQPFTSKLISSNFEMFSYCWYWHKNKPTGFPNANCMPLRDVEDVVVFSGGKANPNAKVKLAYNPQGLIHNPRTKTRKYKPTTVYRGDKDGSLSGEHESKFSNYPRQLLSFNSATKTVHPTQKPVDLMEYLIKTYSKEDDIVLDFTMGSGTTGVAAMNLNRRFIGIEKDTNYFQIASKRIQDTLKTI